MVPTVLAEKGCIEYALATDTPNAGPGQTPLGPNGYCVVEKWDSLESLAAHAASAHMTAFGAKIKDRLTSRAIHILSPG